MIKAFEKTLGYVKKHIIAVVAYSIAFTALLVTALCLLSWAQSGDAERVVSVKAAQLVALDRDHPPTLAQEYIVGQKFDTRGWALKAGGKTYMLDARDIYDRYVQSELDKREDLIVGSEEYEKVLADLTKEGSKYGNAMKELENITVSAEFGAAYDNKRVRITYKKNDYLSYAAEVKGRVLYVRAVEVESYPEYVDMTDGTPEPDDGFSVCAVLGNKPETDAFGQYEQVRGGYKITLDSTMYEMTAVSDDSLKGFYTLSLVCGDVSTEFSFYNDAGRSFIVSSKNNVVHYDTDAVGKSLTLVVTERSDGYQRDCKGDSSGSYIYAAGEQKAVYDFGYSLDGSEETFDSADAVKDGRTDDGYTATVDGTLFTAQADVWQGAVVNGIIVDDHGYKAVIGSEKRILRFDCITPVIELAGTAVPFEANGITVTPGEVKLLCYDNGEWDLSVSYTASNAQDIRTVTVDGNCWRVDGDGIALVVPDFEKSKLGNAAEIRVEQHVDGGVINYSARVTASMPYANPANTSETLYAECETELSGSAASKTVVDLAGADGAGIHIAMESDFSWRLYGDAQRTEEVAGGYWYYAKGETVLCVARDPDGFVYAPDVGDGEVKTLSAKRHATNGKISYSLSFECVTGDGDDGRVKTELVGEQGGVTLPSLTLYVSEYSMNPLLGTGNGYSRGLYVYTDEKGESYTIAFYLQAWVWTYVPLSSSNGDVYAEASVNDYIKDNDGNWNSFRRGTMYADVKFFDRGNGFATVNFYAVEELWLNALLNL